MKYKQLISAAAGALLSTGALAGAYEDVPLSIDFDARVAQGSMVTVRSSKNSAELIGCGVRYIDNGAGGAFSFGFCSAAYDVNEDTFDGVTCFTFNPALVEAIHSISDFSYIVFSWRDDGNGGAECVRIGNSTQSWYLPEKVIK